jgi:hypothetical protein
MFPTVKSAAGLALVINALQIPGATIGQTIVHNGVEFVAATPSSGAPTGHPDPGGDLDPASFYPAPTLNPAIATVVTWGGLQTFSNGIVIATAKAVTGAAELRLTATGAQPIIFKANSAELARMYASGGIAVGHMIDPAGVGVCVKYQGAFGSLDSDNATIRTLAVITGASAAQFSVAALATTVLGSSITFTASGGAVSMTATAAITFTAAASSVWSTSSGSLGIDAATALNLGTANATSVAISRSGENTQVAGTLGVTQLATLSAGLTCSGGAIALTSTGAASLTSTAALTLTGAAASVWSTSSGALTIDAAAALNLGTTNAASMASGSGTTVWTHTGSEILLVADAGATAPVLLTLRHTSSSSAAGIGAGILFQASNTTPSTVSAAEIDGILSTATAGAEVGSLVFKTRQSAVLTEALRIGQGLNVNNGTYTTDPGAGNVVIGTLTGTTPQIKALFNSSLVNLVGVLASVMTFGTTAFDTSLPTARGTISSSTAGWAYGANTGKTHVFNINAAAVVTIAVARVTSVQPVNITGVAVASLPSGTTGDRHYATDLRNGAEGAGAGTGGPVYYGNGAWRRYSDAAAATA